jgi:hypothetical protein
VRGQEETLVTAHLFDERNPVKRHGGAFYCEAGTSAEGRFDYRPLP